MIDEKECFEIFYHPNEYTHLFLSSLDSLEQAESMIERSHFDFVRVGRSEVTYPYLTINTAKHAGDMTQLFFCKTDN
jgi:2,4-dienoyl-CoA reductase-like NADH-dependent reductase (Old Yellow Enzyme family)